MWDGKVGLGSVDSCMYASDETVECGIRTELEQNHGYENEWEEAHNWTKRKCA